MKIFIDFDDVLLNTGNFRNDYKKIFISHGIPDCAYSEFYYDYPVKKRNRKIMKYDPKEHLRRIRKDLQISTKTLERDISRFVKDTGKYIFDDVKGFLKKFKKDDLFLVSYAKTDFQEKKIYNSGIAKYFKGIIITDELKAEAIKSLIKKYKINIREKLFFLDDRSEQIDSIKKQYPLAITFLVRRNTGRYQDRKNKNCYYKVIDLNSANKIIKKLCVAS